MPAMHRRPNTDARSSDFKGSIGRLFKELNTYYILLAAAICFAIASSVLSISAPSRLSDLTDEISDGLVVDADGLKEISTKIQKNMSQERLQTVMTSDALTIQEKQEVMAAFSDTSDRSAMIEQLDTLSDHEKETLLPTITVQNQKISTADQIKFLKISTTIGKDPSAKQLYKKIDQMPSSVQTVVRPHMDMDAIKHMAQILAVIYLASAVLMYLQGRIMAVVSNRFSRSLRSRIDRKINCLPLAYFDRSQTGDILSLVTNDVDTIAQTLNQSLGMLVSSVTLLVGSLIMMYVTNVTMANTAVLSSLLGFVLIIVIMNRSQKYFRRRQSALGKLNGHVEEVYAGIPVLKSYHAMGHADQRFDMYNRDVYTANRYSQFFSGLMPNIMTFVGNFSYAAVCIVGAMLTMDDVITFGVIISFIMYVRLFTNPLSQLAQAFTSLQSSAAAAERVFKLLDEPEMAAETATITLPKEEVKGVVDFDHVRFGYDPEKIVIHDFNAHVEPGQKIAIVGPTGAGKTAMVNLLMKFYPLQDGDIRIDGHSTKDLTRENVHELFTMVLQDTWLLRGTVRENIAFNHENVSDEKIWQICDTIGLSHFIHSLPNGLDTELSDENSVSVGQKQLLTIARGMMEETPFLILDEATSNVDTRTEELVQKAMDRLAADKTSFIIAHRLSTIRNADLILVMNHGDIIEQGNHEELMKQNGFYADLYNSQFSM
ncbi:ABC transporter ATP-binding protein [Catenisphaera adipataccumulans]|uniref:ATP-binding cassette subfamily B protein n=1 Tax=Catenisphaera adipataccumulans TaxID=700500 RepID=A0A7W8D0K0_9FIRM|nr:ABC transporter ATP-binding protein [Catenisphaera adipataccumulans]MBB5183797.1 ATP-binding cassette subfamily B protein [Catenisphaera adipataccumulans]